MDYQIEVLKGLHHHSGEWVEIDVWSTAFTTKDIHHFMVQADDMALDGQLKTPGGVLVNLNHFSALSYAEFTPEEYEEWQKQRRKETKQ